MMEYLSSVASPLGIAVIFAGCLVWFTKKSMKLLEDSQRSYNHLVENHLKHHTEAATKQANAAEKLYTRIGDYMGVVNDLMDVIRSTKPKRTITR